MSAANYVRSNWRKLEAIASEKGKDSYGLLLAICDGWLPGQAVTPDIKKYVHKYAHKPSLSDEELEASLAKVTEEVFNDFLKTLGQEAKLKHPWTGTWADVQDTPPPVGAKTGAGAGETAPPPGKVNQAVESEFLAANAAQGAGSPKPKKDENFWVQVSPNIGQMLDSNERGIRQAGIGLVLSLVQSRYRCTSGDVTAAATKQAAVAEHFAARQKPAAAAPVRGPQPKAKKQGKDPEEETLRRKYQQTAGDKWMDDPGYKAAIKALRQERKEKKRAVKP